MQSSKEMSCGAVQLVLEAVYVLAVHKAVTRNVRIKLCCNPTLKTSRTILFFNLPLCPRPSKAHLAVIIGRSLIQRCVPFDTTGRADSPLSRLSLFFCHLFFFPLLTLPPSLNHSLSCSFSPSLFWPRSILTPVPFSPLCLTATASVTSRAASAHVALCQDRKSVV